MATESRLTKIQQCLYLRNSVELWIDDDKAERVKQDLMSGNVGNFIKVENRVINVKEIVGIFSAQELDDLKRRKNGQWKCEYGAWHNKFEVCDCGRFSKEERERLKK